MLFEFKNRSLRILVIALATILAAAACTAKKTGLNQENPSQKSKNASIVNGRPVTLKDAFWKYTVSLGPKEEPICTGVIISDDSVLTAGHCADGLENTYVHFGLDFAANSSIRLKIKSVTAHPDYCENCAMDESLGDPADISVVKFEGGLPAGFAPIEFAKKADLKVGQTITLAGFGLNEKGIYETIMKFTTVPLKELGSSEFATDETKSGSCNGDSGGPAFIEDKGKYRLAGITSRGDAKCRKVGVYTVPDSYNDWILEVATKP